MDKHHLRAYAHLGDAVYEVFIREKVINVTSNSKKMHELTTRYVKAEFQVEMLDSLEEILTEEEKELVRRARNLPSTSFRRAAQSLHRYATAFEALLGYNYLHNRERYEVILAEILPHINP